MQQPHYSVSVVIPTYNGRPLLEKHLPAVIKASKGCEIIVVDDASNDNTKEWLQSTYPEIHLISLDKNVRFAQACNTAVEAAKGELILLLNNDVSPQSDVLIHLLPHFNDPTVFATGCLEEDQTSKNLSGRSQAVFERGIVRHFKAHDQTQSDTLWVSGGSGMFRKSVWIELEGFDTLFKPAYDEDRDLAYRALKRGYLVQFEPKSRVEHTHESTNQSAFNSFLLEAAKHKNGLLFIWKNITTRTYLLRHLLWLPYHLVVTTLRTRGTFLLGFLWAVSKLPEVRTKRAEEKIHIRVSDEKLLPLA